MKPSEQKKIIINLTGRILEWLPQELKLSNVKAERTILRHVRHLIRKLEAQHYKETRRAARMTRKKKSSGPPQPVAQNHSKNSGKMAEDIKYSETG
jgi:hypothetical protein